MSNSDPPRKPESRQRVWVIVGADEGERLDQFLAKSLDGVSRRQVRQVIDEGGVFLNGRRCRVASRILREGARVQWDGRSLEWSQAFRESSDQRMASVKVVFQTQNWVLLSKPAGLHTQGTEAGNRWTLLNWVEANIGTSFPIHRLDYLASGLIVVALNSAEAARLSSLMKSHRLARTYLAVVEGELHGSGMIDVPIEDRGVKRMARSHYRSKLIKGNQTLVEVELETGRTHQVRIHLASLGHPICGDHAYGSSSKGGQQIALHAWKLSIDGQVFCEEPDWNSPLWKNVH